MAYASGTARAWASTATKRLAIRGAREYGLTIEVIIVLIALAIAAITALALSPLARRNGRASMDETREKARGVDRGKFLR